jgi:hypothetical protein
LPSEHADSLQVLTAELASQGLFVVPVGEIKQWFSKEEIRGSKNKKRAWANEAALYLAGEGRANMDICQFVKRIGDYLTALFS